MIRLPSKDYKIDSDCVMYLYNTLKEYVITHAERYLKDGINIWLHNEKHRVKYRNHIYNICVIKKDDLLYFYLKPYKNDCLIILATNYSVYEQLINVIKEHDKNFYKSKEINSLKN